MNEQTVYLKCVLEAETYEKAAKIVLDATEDMPTEVHELMLPTISQIEITPLMVTNATLGLCNQVRGGYNLKPIENLMVLTAEDRRFWDAQARAALEAGLASFKLF